eukprot:5988423-Amphidinium_carterae.1
MTKPKTREVIRPMKRALLAYLSALNPQTTHNETWGFADKGADVSTPSLLTLNFPYSEVQVRGTQRSLSCYARF